MKTSFVMQVQCLSCWSFQVICKYLAVGSFEVIFSKFILKLFQITGCITNLDFCQHTDSKLVMQYQVSSANEFKFLKSLN